MFLYFCALLLLLKYNNTFSSRYFLIYIFVLDVGCWVVIFPNVIESSTLHVALKRISRAERSGLDA